MRTSLLGKGLALLFVASLLSGCGTPAKSLVGASSSLTGTTGSNSSPNISPAEFLEVVTYISQSAQPHLILTSPTANITTAAFAAHLVAIRPHANATSPIRNTLFNSDGSIGRGLSKVFKYDNDALTINAKLYIKNALNDDADVRSTTAFDDYDEIQQSNAFKIVLSGNGESSAVRANFQISNYAISSYKTEADLQSLFASRSSSATVAQVLETSFQITDKNTDAQAMLNKGKVEIIFTMHRANGLISRYETSVNFIMPYVFTYGGHDYSFTFQKSTGINEINGVQLGTSTDLLQDGRKIGTISISNSGVFSATDLSGNSYSLPQ